VLYLTFFILGAIWGSFSNVCIYRLPLKKNIVFNRSFCPNCKIKIKWLDNIPLLSFLLLKNRCRSCNDKISTVYFIVEFLTAVLFVIIYHFYGLTLTTLLFLILLIFFIIIFFIDLKHFIIPNQLTFPLMVIGFIKSFDPNLNQSIFPNYINSLIGGLFGYLIIWIIIFLYKKFRDKEGMGLGDAKLLSAIGFWFGWACIPFVIFISSVIALITVTPSLIQKSKKMSSQIPYGPFIITACALYIMFNQQIKILFF